MNTSYLFKFFYILINIIFIIINICNSMRIINSIFHILLIYLLQEDANRGKPNWEHLSDDLHVLITVEDTENRAKVKLAQAVAEVQKLLVPVSTSLACQFKRNPFASG